MNKAVNKGYLLENFRLFHLKDQCAPEVESHYHEFDKIVVLFSGSVDYHIEGATYHMCPGDVLFVRHHDIHRPVIDPDSIYERVILWITPEILSGQRAGADGFTLETCFDLSSARHSCLYRPGDMSFARLKRLLLELGDALAEDSSVFGSALLSDAYFLQLLVELNRMVLHAPGEMPQNADRQISEALRYIHTHLSDPLSVDALASSCYLSRYYFMRRFKAVTGYTVHGYILQKRLAAAAEQLDGGAGVQEAARTAGFTEYSSFLRAFRKAFDMTPSDYLRRNRQLDGDNLE